MVIILGSQCLVNDIFDNTIKILFNNIKILTVLKSYTLHNFRQIYSYKLLRILQDKFVNLFATLSFSTKIIALTNKMFYSTKF